MMRAPSSLLLLALFGLAGCASQGPATERGFFGGVNAAITGDDERQARALENEAADREARVRAMAARADQADRDARSSTAQVQAAEQRLAALQASIQRQRYQVNALRNSGRSMAEADRISTGLDQLERDRAAAAGRGGSIDPAALQQLEDRARALNQSLARLGAT